MRIFNESICWTDWIQCFDEWTLIYLITLSITSITLTIIILLLIKKIPDKK